MKHLLKYFYFLPLYSCCFFTGELLCQNHLIAKNSWGDQGDGTYKNPVLNADYPDVDIEKLGDTYYMISSKQHMSPGMVILESKDLVNWKIIGHVWPQLSWGNEYNWDRMNGYGFGVWAGDLAYHNNTWYCYHIDYKHGLMVSTAKNIKGPWSKPTLMLPSEKVLDDPAVYWDEEEHQAYLICNTQRKQSTQKNNLLGNENRLYKMSWDGTKIIDEGKVIYAGYGAEAAKIYKINKQWYIFISEWYLNSQKELQKNNANNDRKQIVLRSSTSSIYGPYDKKIVLEKGTVFGSRSASQGALVQAPNKSWWYYHQLIQNSDNPIEGRSQCLEPVVWQDGWPMIGIDTDNNGIGEPVLQYKKPINGYSITAPQTDDDFSTNKLGLQWEWNHNPRNNHWSLKERKGWLRLKAGGIVMKSTETGPVENQWTNGLGKNNPFWRASNTLSQRLMGTTTGTAIAKFNLLGMAIGQVGGFVRFGGVYHLIGIYVNKENEKQLFFTDKTGNTSYGPIITTNDLYLRTINSGNKAWFSYSTNGKKFHNFGENFTIEFGKWTGDRLGFFTWNTLQEKGYIDVDYFNYIYDGPK